MNRILLISIAVFTLYSCVPSSKFEDLKSRQNRTQEQLDNCEEKLTNALEEKEALTEKLSKAKESVADLKMDTAVLGQRYRKIKELNEDVNDMYETLKDQYKELLSNTVGQKEKLSMELEMKKRELERKEKDLEELEASLKAKENNINDLQDDLEERSERVRQLEEVLSRKDSTVNALKSKIKDALLGFKESELSVELKNGKVYVSMADKLLFPSGSTIVNPKGKEALQKLAEVLKNHPDLNILVEGHTDNVPIQEGSRIKDNWDLSVLRATSVVRLLVEDYKVSPEKVIAAGRSKFQPVASNDSREGKRKNRRTEIILTPNLGEVLQILETN